jgi:hypothetical protein
LPSLGYENIPKFLHRVTNILWKVVEKLGLSYCTSKELNDIIDKVLPGPPPFQCMNLSVGGEDLEFHYREIIPSIRSLFSNPKFAHKLIYAVTDLPGPPSAQTAKEKLEDLKQHARRYARDQGSCDDIQISYLETLEGHNNDTLWLAQMIAQ